MCFSLFRCCGDTVLTSWSVSVAFISHETYLLKQVSNIFSNKQNNFQINLLKGTSRRRITITFLGDLPQNTDILGKCRRILQLVL